MDMGLHPSSKCSIVQQSLGDHDLPMSGTSAWHLPATVPIIAWECHADSCAPSQWLHQDETALQLAAEKRAAVVMADGAFAELAQTAVQGFAAGWEIPVTVLPTSKYVHLSDGNQNQGLLPWRDDCTLGANNVS